MSTTEIYDHRLLHFLQSEIKKLPLNQQITLKTVGHCGSKVLRAMGHEPGVFLLNNDNGEAKFWGYTSCKNSWCCPVCSAKLMSKYSSQIATAIDAMKEKGQVAVMITFTVLHIKSMKVTEVTDILYNTWKKFMTHGNKTGYCYQYKQKNKVRYKTGKVYKIKDPFAAFCEDVGCKHRVRVGEFTWGRKNGWHPHFHCLFWVDKNKIDKVGEWEKTLENRWYDLATKETIKYFNKINPENPEYNEKRAKNLYAHKSEDSRGVFISRNEDGTVREQLSSDYICGWGADKELTGNVRKEASHEEHLTPYQILEKASNGDKEMLNLYIEFCIGIYSRKHARINFSTRSGIKKIISLYQQTEKYREFIKKKSIRDRRVWKVLMWFTEKQWWNICDLDKKFPIKSNILYLASIGKIQLLKEYLLHYNINVDDNKEHELKFLIQDLMNFGAEKEKAA